jgi:hypothetical protein
LATVQTNSCDSHCALSKEEGDTVFQLLIYRHSGDGHSDVTMPISTMKHSGDGRSEVLMPVLLQSTVAMGIDDVTTEFLKTEIDNRFIHSIYYTIYF